MATAALYAGIRQMGLPRSVEEVGAVSRVEEMEFKRAYRYINQELDLQIAPPKPQQYLSRFASDLDVDEETERRARELLTTAEEQALHSGKSPVGLAGAALYAAGILTNQQTHPGRGQRGRGSEQRHDQKPLPRTHGRGGRDRRPAHAHRLRLTFLTRRRRNRRPTQRFWGSMR